MESSILYLIIGIFTGALITSLIFIQLNNGAKKKQASASEERTQLIRSIAEMFTDIDTLITSFRSGIISEEAFRSSTSSKLDAINKLYKPNMHILDVYYVKYIDSQFFKYSEIAHGNVEKVQFESKATFDFENISDFDSANKPLPQSEAVGAILNTEENVASDNDTIIDPVSENPVEVAVDESPALIQKPEPIDPLNILEADKNLESEADLKDFDDVATFEDEIANSAELPKSSEIDPLSENVSEEISVVDEEPIEFAQKPAEITIEPIELTDEPIVPAEVPDDLNFENDIKPNEEAIVIGEHSDSDELPVVEEPFISKDTGLSGELENSATDNSDINLNNADEDVFSFEVDAAISDQMKFTQIGQTAIETNGAEELANSTQPDTQQSDAIENINLDNGKSSFQKEYEQATREPDEEDFMETIMDLDMGKLLRTTGSFNAESINKTTIPPKYSPFKPITDTTPSDQTQQPPKINEQESLGGALHETIMLKADLSDGEPVKSEKSQEQEKIVVARGDEGSENTVLDDSPAEFELLPKAADESKDVTITGDDVASKIDSFFGFK